MPIDEGVARSAGPRVTATASIESSLVQGAGGARIYPTRRTAARKTFTGAQGALGAHWDPMEQAWVGEAR